MKKLTAERVRKAEQDFLAANDLSSQTSLLLVEGPRMFDRITSDSAILGGKPIIRGTRISVAMILEWTASGADRDAILRKHPQLTADDVEQAATYAASAVQNEVLLSGDKRWMDLEFMDSCASDTDLAIRLEDVRAALAKIGGSMDSAIDETRGEW